VLFVGVIVLIGIVVQQTQQKAAVAAELEQARQAANTNFGANFHVAGTPLPSSPPAGAETTASTDGATSVDTTPPQPPAAIDSAPTPSAPKDTIVGKWKLSQSLGNTYLTFTEEGRYTIRNILGMTETGLYVLSPDGTLRMQQESFFSPDTTIWHCHVSGDTMSVLEGDTGAPHMYSRIE
jgi:hypothetical protein